MQNLTEYLAHLKEQHLQAIAAETVSLSSIMNVPIIKDRSGASKEMLLKRSMKIFTDFADSLASQTYDLKQTESLRKYMEGNKTQSNSDSFRPSDLVFLYALQRKVLRKFLPTYTNDLQVALGILDELEALNLRSQQIGISVLLKSARETSEALTRSNTFLTAILENLPNMIFVKDADELRFVRLNKAGEELLGFSITDLLGKNDYDFFPKEQADFFVENDRAVLEDGKLIDIPEEPIQTRHQGERWLHTKKIPLAGIDGKPAYLLGISEDITEKKKKDDALNELNQELEAFSYSISHDLRAPLRAMNGYAQILEEEHAAELSEEATRLLNAIRHNSKKMGTLIDELLTFSRLGRKEIKRSAIDMTELIEGVIGELNTERPHHAQILYKNLHPLIADYGLIHQVLYNLLSNALKYSSRESSPRIEITSKIEGNLIIYTVKDNGVGFNMKYIDKLFGVFQRLHNSDEFEGVGVGLAIVKRVIKRHGGNVWATGEVNHGAAFCFSVPFS